MRPGTNPRQNDRLTPDNERHHLEPLAFKNSAPVSGVPAAGQRSVAWIFLLTRGCMIEVDTLAEAFVRHVGSCRSADIVCALPIAVESWFRVELIPALIYIGVPLEQVNFNFTYPQLVCIAGANEAL